MDYHDLLKNIQPEHDHFIGIDSDGCVFDTMEIKQKKFFIPNALKFFNLYPVEKTLRETWEFVNLYSVYRGGNRFASLIRVFDYLRERSEIRNTGISLPELRSLKQWVNTETKLSNQILKRYIDSHYDSELELILRWSENINREIEDGMNRIHPFPGALMALRELSGIADLVIVSQTPLEALEKEWRENNINQYVRFIAAQEHGTKAEHIKYAAIGKYPEGNIMMIGDAKGDLEASQQNNILFYPVIPGREDLSWQRFLKEPKDRFFGGTFRGQFEDKLHREFEISLPAEPIWNK